MRTDSQTHFHNCASAFPYLDCSMFTGSAARSASTMSFTILVVIEMFNACNSLSEDESLLVLPLWTNPYLIAAIALSMGLHFVILYVPFFHDIFSVTYLNWEEWRAVLWLSLPVIFIDEVLKFISMRFVSEYNS